MKKIAFLILLFFLFTASLKAQNDNISPDFVWGNTFYFNLNIGESVWFLQNEIKLLSVENLCNTISVDKDTVIMKIGQHSLPKNINGLKIFVADNRNLFFKDDDTQLRGLLKKDALLAVCNVSNALLTVNDYIFPVSFNKGFTWNLESQNFPFSVTPDENNTNDFKISNGKNFNLQAENGIENHWMVAIEDSRVVWIKESNSQNNQMQVDVLLESRLNPGIYYYYGNLYKRSLEVRDGQNLISGELIGTVASDKSWGLVHFSVLKNDTVPDISDVNTNVVNFFPQLFELYFKTSFNFPKLFSKGDITLGKSQDKKEINNLSFEEYTGKGWILGCWNSINKVPYAERGIDGNIRLHKTLFADTPFESVNPEDYYDYEINVNNGLYRVRIEVGDVELATYQQVEFEDYKAGEFVLGKGKQEWTAERIVRINDGKLTVRIYVDPENNAAAGVSEIVFQRVQ